MGEAREKVLPVDQLIYPRTVAMRLQCSESLVYQLIQRGELDACRIGIRGVRVLESSLKRYIEKNRIDPAE